jgi:two-component system chemotaxis response regulator CheB
MTRAATGLVVIAGSAGSLAPLLDILEALPADFPCPVVVILHGNPSRPSLLPSLVARRAALGVRPASEGDRLQTGFIYIVPPDQHASVTSDGNLRLFDGSRIRHVRSSANPMLDSAAAVYDGRVIAVVLSGSGMDATDGVQSVKARGGTVIVQDEATSRHFGMPGSAIATGAVDLVLPANQIAETLRRLTRSVPA